MRTETITRNIYTFEELSYKAKDTARAWYREGNEYTWCDEALSSVRAFCDMFGVSITDYTLCTWQHSYIETDATNANFRWLKLKSIDRDAMPTGYCLDSDLMYTFYDEFKRTGDALYAFSEAIDAAVRAIVSDMEYQETDEYVDEQLLINEYEFTDDGERV